LGKTMEPFRYHVFMCNQCKAEGVPCCAVRGSGNVIEALRHEIAAQGLIDEVQITLCGSVGLCERGPNMVVYPEGVWYSAVQPKDVPEIVPMMVESVDPHGPFGAKGIGEPPYSPPAPAIANAIYNAIGLRFSELPITNRAVLTRLKAVKG